MAWTTRAAGTALRKRCARRGARIALAAVLVAGAGLRAQEVAIDASPAGRRQVIDGFGTCVSGDEGLQAWWQEAFLDDLGASILRIDLVPRFKSPWSDLSYYSPWFRGRGNQPYAFNYEVDASHTPRHYTGPAGSEFVAVGASTYYNGPEGNRARTYSDAASYQRIFGGRSAPLAVMGPNIDDNISRCFDLTAGPAPVALALLEAARARDAGLQRFRLVGSIWSPMPWVKVPSGTSVGARYGFWPFATTGTPFPFVSGGNFVGGRLDVSETPVSAFDDSGLPADAGGPNAGAARGPTSALVQFARATAAWVRAVQNHTGARFFAISIQNELNFETFYNSCTYPLSSQYIKALRYVRAEFDKYDDLRGVLLMGPEDLLSDSTYSLWQYGAGPTTVHKNLQYLQNVGLDPQALADLGLFCIHGYAPDGVNAAGADPVAWKRWAWGWIESPAAGIPANVKGFAGYGKRCWMTETSGEEPAWLAPANDFPGDGGFSIAVKLHQALTAGEQSGWIYWQMSDGDDVGESTLTDSKQRASSAKFTAMRHFSRYIRPGAVRLETATGSERLLASAYHHEADRTLTVVLVNSAPAAAAARVAIPSQLVTYTELSSYTSSDGRFWQAGTPTAEGSVVPVSVPGYGVVTVVAAGVPPPPAPARPEASFDAGGLHLSWPAVGGAQTYTVERGPAAEGPYEVLAAGLESPAFLVRAFHAGVVQHYRTLAVGSGGASAASPSVAFSPPVAGSPASRLVNISTRGAVQGGHSVMIAGFVVEGTEPVALLVRGIGPALIDFGLPDALTDPVLALHQAEGGLFLLGNDDWGLAPNVSLVRDAFARTGAFALDEGTPDAALLVIVVPGIYTAIVSGKDAGTGIAMVEVYEVANDAP